MNYKIFKKDDKTIFKFNRQLMPLDTRNVALTYLKLLNAKEIESPNEKERLFVLDGITLKLNYNENSLRIMGELPEKVSKVFEETNLKNLFHGSIVSFLESLILLHTIMSYDEDSLIEKYDEEINRINNLAIINEYEEKARLFNKDLIELPKLNENCLELENSIDKLCAIAYPLISPNIKDHLEEFSNETECYVSGESKNISFSWQYKSKDNEVWSSHFEFNGDIVIIISYYDKRQLEKGCRQIMYSYRTIPLPNHIKTCQLKYFPQYSLNYSDSVELDLINNRIRKAHQNDGQATKKDYERFREIIDEFYDRITNELPYIKIEKEKVKQKEKGN